MGLSTIQEQRDKIIDTIRRTTHGDWKVLVIDEAASKILYNVVKEDDILNENIANVERIEEKREMNPGMDAIYILSPQPHIVDCLMADLEARRYRKFFLLWTTLLDPEMRRRIDNSQSWQACAGGFDTLSIDYYPCESHLITFRDSSTFPILYHPACNNLVRDHMQLLAQKITGVCVTLGENPKIRYYRPRNPIHEASVLCSHLARFVQEELDAYAEYNRDFPPPSNRQQGILVITDRAMDMHAPLMHEFTYQAMAHDLVLDSQDDDRVLYRMSDEDTGKEKEMEIAEKDRIWVENRHQHMSKTIEKLMGDFKKFIADNPGFADSANANIYQMKDMVAGMSQFMETKDSYSLHLSMAQECMNIFAQRELMEIALAEQTLATGLDEDYRKPKNLADQVIHLLDNPSTGKEERLRLIILYIMHREGLIMEDIELLLHHAELPLSSMEVITNLELLGVRVSKTTLKDAKPAQQPLFVRKAPPTVIDESLVLSRYQPNLQAMLEEITKGTLGQDVFPYTKPPPDNGGEMALQAQNASLRSAKPTWARNRQSAPDNMQRVIVFMAGGATFSESRTCYEVSKQSGRDVVLATSHMLTPGLFLKQVGGLSVDRRRLDLPVDRPKPVAPAHLFERERPPPLAQSLGPPRQAVPLGLPLRPAADSRSPTAPPPVSKPEYPAYRPPPQPPVQAVPMKPNAAPAPPMNGKLEKKKDKKDKHKHDGEEKEKKKGFFGRKK